MKRVLIVFLAVGSLRAAVYGDYTGLVCQPYVGEDWIENRYAELTTYRVYASFDNLEDSLLFAGGSGDPPLVLEPSGGAFHNAKIDSLTAPRDLRFAGIWENQWDTYVTIDTDTAEGDATTVSVGFGDETGYLRGYVNTDNAGWFITLKALPQGLADGGLVLIAQLTVPCGDGISGMVTLLLGDGSLLEGQTFVCAFIDDCNGNCLSDDLEIEMGLTLDCNGNGLPDECEDLPCLRADLDCNGVVNFGDVLLVLIAWGPCEGCREDIDGNGLVGFSDLLIVLANHGTCE